MGSRGGDTAELFVALRRLLSEDLAIRFKRLRNGRELSQDALARAAGTTKTHVYQIEHGLRKRMHQDTLERYAKALAVSPEHLEHGVDARSLQLAQPASPEPASELRSYLRLFTQLNEERIERLATVYFELLTEQLRQEGKG